MSSTPTVFLIDDDSSVLKGVSRLLRASGFAVMTFDSASKFLQSRDPSAHGCIVLDLAMPGESGIDLQEALAADGATQPIIFLTGRGDIPTSVRAMKQGASDFLTKPVRGEELIRAVRVALKQDLAARAERDRSAKLNGLLATLTTREREVFEHVASGKLNKQTAADLGTVEKTIKVHRARIMEKLQVKSAAELARLAERAGVLPLPPAGG